MSKSKFKELLEQLEQEHEKELASLRKHIVSNEDGSRLPRISVTQEHHGHTTVFGSDINLDLDAKAASDEVQRTKTKYLLEDAEQISHGVGERIFYLVENLASMYDNFFLALLVVLTGLISVLLGAFWKLFADDDVQEDTSTLYFVLDMFQLITSGGITTGLYVHAGRLIVYALGLATGMVIFAILVGIITSKFEGFILSVNEGKSQVPEKDHTLLLGWNESTERVVCQIAMLRRQLIIQNSGIFKKVFWWTRTIASTPVAKARIVILCDNKTKEEMHSMIKRAFVERGISPKRTRVGWDVICRVGDPTSTMDLNMVGAHSAKGIAIMMSEKDLEEEEVSGARNGATFRTLLALRQVLFAPERCNSIPWEDLRIVVPLTRPSRDIHSAVFTTPIKNPKLDDDGKPIPCQRKVVLVQDLSLFVNTLLFTCAMQPGLGDVLMELMSFDGVALRLREVTAFPNGGENLIGKTVSNMTHFWDDAVLVGVIPPEPMDPADPDPHQGIAPSCDRIITPNDRLVFLCMTSSPSLYQKETILHRVSRIRRSVSSQNEATDFKPLEPAVVTTAVRSSCSSRTTQVPAIDNPSKLLVSGFRQEWLTTPARFAFRIADIASSLSQGSVIHFLNQIPEQEFEALMEQLCALTPERGDKYSPGDFTRDTSKPEQPTWIFQKKVTVMYSFGDAANYEILEPIVHNGKFHVAVIVPPAKSNLTAVAADTRLMSIMCILRTIVSAYNIGADENHKLPTLHVVGENKLEASAGLAMRPLCPSKGVDESDFVNVQAIIARAMCQALAYPFMQPALVQLLISCSGSPTLHLCNAGNFLPFDQEVSFGEVIKHVRTWEPNDICIGYRAYDDKRLHTKLNPRKNDKRAFQEGDLLIILSRGDSPPCGALNVVEEPVTPERSVLLPWHAKGSVSPRSQNLLRKANAFSTKQSKWTNLPKCFAGAGSSTEETGEDRGNASAASGNSTGGTYPEVLSNTSESLLQDGSRENQESVPQEGSPKKLKTKKVKTKKSKVAMTQMGMEDLFSIASDLTEQPINQSPTL